MHNCLFCNKHYTHRENLYRHLREDKFCGPYYQMSKSSNNNNQSTNQSTNHIQPPTPTMADITYDLIVKLQSYHKRKLTKEQIFGILLDEPIVIANFQELRTYCLEKGNLMTQSAKVARVELQTLLSKMGNPEELYDHHQTLFHFFNEVIKKQVNITEQNKAIDQELLVIEAYKATLIFFRNFKSGQEVQNFELIKEFFETTLAEAFQEQTDMTGLEQLTKRQRVEEPSTNSSSSSSTTSVGGIGLGNLLSFLNNN